MQNSSAEAVATSLHSAIIELCLATTSTRSARAGGRSSSKLQSGLPRTQTRPTTTCYAQSGVKQRRDGEGENHEYLAYWTVYHPMDLNTDQRWTPTLTPIA